MARLYSSSAPDQFHSDRPSATASEAWDSARLPPKDTARRAASSALGCTLARWDGIRYYKEIIRVR